MFTVLKKVKKIFESFYGLLSLSRTKPVGCAHDSTFCLWQPTLTLWCFHYKVNKNRMHLAGQNALFTHYSCSHFHASLKWHVKIHFTSLWFLCWNADQSLLESSFHFSWGVIPQYRSRWPKLSASLSLSFRQLACFRIGCRNLSGK